MQGKQTHPSYTVLPSKNPFLNAYFTYLLWVGL